KVDAGRFRPGAVRTLPRRRPGGRGADLYLLRRRSARLYAGRTGCAVAPRALRARPREDLLHAALPGARQLEADGGELPGVLPLSGRPPRILPRRAGLSGIAGGDSRLPGSATRALDRIGPVDARYRFHAGQRVSLLPLSDAAGL